MQQFKRFISSKETITFLTYFCIVYLLFSASIFLEALFGAFLGLSTHCGMRIYIFGLTALIFIGIFLGFPSLLAAYGVFKGKSWGYRLGIIMMGVNVLSTIVSVSKNPHSIFNGSFITHLLEILTLVSLIYLKKIKAK
ncbi:hypothetical protein C5B42_01455 [Candidatus Cerribacteria bacterium 'Amazon FNV 2010 28 9']|uniref:Uncharacterized protein n=1 Tax=Candidatus Cerribacteria bacterium 'Amazon FNV 2010 28 9' TaxID=2081795 RepID=A0A317JS30_9BACT|nr:MAG: hypothetical protein C5B42_01455 [Candidatus Cerribacteria bacterium 'Amazon FNV 2010 28 9']